MAGGPNTFLISETVCSARASFASFFIAISGFHFRSLPPPELRDPHVDCYCGMVNIWFFRINSLGSGTGVGRQGTKATDKEAGCGKIFSRFCLFQLRAVDL